MNVFTFNRPTNVTINKGCAFTDVNVLKHPIAESCERRYTND